MPMGGVCVERYRREKELRQAAGEGKTDRVRQLLAEGVNPNLDFYDGAAPLHNAASGGHVGVAEILLEAGAQVDKRDEFGAKPIHEAAYKGHVGVVKLLLKAGEKVDSRHRNKATPLHKAAEGGHVGVAELLLKEGAQLDSRDRDGNTPEDKAKRVEASSYLYQEKARVLEGRKRILDLFEQRRPITDNTAAWKSGTRANHEDLGMSTKKGENSAPLEIQLRGPRMQQLYSQACRQGARPVHNARGLVVGQFRSGKTCVVRRLTGEKAVEDEPITDGIEISPSVNTKTWQKAKEEPDEFKETMAERLAELQERNKRNKRSDRKKPTDDGKSKEGRRTLQALEKKPLKEKTPAQIQQTPKLENEDAGQTEEATGKQTLQTQQKKPLKKKTLAPTAENEFEGRGEDVGATTTRQTQVQQQQTENIPDDVIMKAKERLQGGVTEEHLGTAEHPRLSIWDFGGQATYYGSHQCFFTHRGIYILVMSLLQKLSDPVPDLDYKASADNLITGRGYLDHWLNSVRTHGLVHGREHTGHPPVVLVLTNRDMVTESDIENYKKDVLNHISAKAAGKHVLPKIFVVDNFKEDNSDIDELREYLLEVAKAQWYMGQEVPITWLHLKSKLMDKRREDDPFCRFQDVVDLARSDDVGITDDKHVADILTFLHDLGDIIFINEPGLRDHVALRPQVMIDVFKTIITVPEYQQDRSTNADVADMWRRLENEGILSDRLLTIIWTKVDQLMQKPFLLRNKSFLKRLMEKYYLICNATSIRGFDDTIHESEKEEIYFVPSLLAAKPDDGTLYPVQMSRYRYPLYVVFDNMFLPSGMFYRLQAICVRRFGLEMSQVFASSCRFPTDDAKQQFVVTKVTHYLKVELLSSESEDQAVFTQGLPVRKFLSSCLFEIKEKWIPSIQYCWCFGEESEEIAAGLSFHPLSEIGQETTTPSRVSEAFVDVWTDGNWDQRTPRAENSGGTGPELVTIGPTMRPGPVHRIGPILDCMETCGGLSLTECDRIKHELTFVSRFKELVATIDRAGDKCRRLLLGASVEVCLPERAPMFLREERGNEIVILHVGDYELATPLFEKAVQSSSRYGVTVCEDVIKTGDVITDKLLDHLLKQNVRMVVPIITPQALRSRYWSTLGYEFPVQNKNLVFPVFAYPEGTRERLLKVLGRRCAGMLEMSSTEVPMTKEPLSSTKISLTAAEILREASSSVVLNTYKITPEGCTLEEDGVTISFPKGCVETERFLSLEVEMLPIDHTLTTAFSAVTPVLTVQQEQEEDFLQPATVTLPWAWKKSSNCSTDKAVLMERKPHRPQWTALRVEFQETEEAVTFTTRHFCGIAGVRQSEDDGKSSTSSGEGTGNQDEAANQEAAGESIGEPGNQDEAANQGAVGESITREPGNQGEAANQKTAGESITREPGNQGEAANKETAGESMTREPGNQDEAANQEAAGESITREPENQDEAANQEAAGESIREPGNQDEAANQEAAGERIREPGNQDEAANQKTAGESNTREPGNQDEAANQEAAGESITKEPENQDEATSQGLSEESIKRKRKNPDEAANKKVAEERISRKPDNQDESANQRVAAERISRESNVPSATTSTNATGAYQDCWNRYNEDKVYLIINPNQATADNNNIHLMCVHKDDDPTDFFHAANMQRLPPFHQRIAMGREERIDAEFDARKEVIGDPHDVSDGISFFFPPANSNRWSVGLILNNPDTVKKMYKGTVHFKLFSESGERVIDLRRRIPSATVFLRTDQAPCTDEGETSQKQQRDGEKIGTSQTLEMKPRKAATTPVLMVSDRYGTFHEDTSTFNRQVAQFLQRHGATVHSTALQASEDDKSCAIDDGVSLHLPVQSTRKKKTPSLDWLTDYHSVHYPDIPQDLKCIVGHTNVTSGAAKSIQENRCQHAKLVLFNHDMPEDTEHYKGAKKALTAGTKVEDILEDTKNVDVVFSLGKRIYDHYETKYNSLGDSKPTEHLMFLPKPSPLFEAISVSPGGGEKVVLTVGRVTEVEKLKGHDLVARAIGDVAEKITNVKLRVRGINEDNLEASRKILEENLHSERIKPTLLPCGTQEDIAQDMQQAHLVLMPSRAEPFGLIGLEAMAAGIPVLISDKSGLADMIMDLIKDGKCHPDMRHRIVRTSVSESDLDETAKRWAEKISDTLEFSESEFEKAAEFKKRLLESRYWEESHQNLLRVCGLTD